MGSTYAGYLSYATRHTLLLLRVGAMEAGVVNFCAKAPSGPFHSAVPRRYSGARPLYAAPNTTCQTGAKPMNGLLMAAKKYPASAIGLGRRSRSASVPEKLCAILCEARAKPSMRPTTPPLQRVTQQRGDRRS